ncbi:hypothetical protein EVAR_55105_1 [Eumeta japonica]|uniref:Uncharacterized protein n=1 Tax=Eumeta variegata TaxID=151549 RepID=A0A4C1YKH2_EUMVA|nr:hypothetical protein EVAR_55105_1 [Eumeta japonica]
MDEGPIITNVNRSPPVHRQSEIPDVRNMRGKFSNEIDKRVASSSARTTIRGSGDKAPGPGIRFAEGAKTLRKLYKGNICFRGRSLRAALNSLRLSLRVIKEKMVTTAHGATSALEEIGHLMEGVGADERERGKWASGTLTHLTSLL